MVCPVVVEVHDVCLLMFMCVVWLLMFMVCPVVIDILVHGLS